MQTPYTNFDAWRELRLLCSELATFLESRPERGCFVGAHQLTRDLMPTALACGIFTRPFDWTLATRENPGPLATYFEDFPQLDNAEALEFHAPAGTQWERIILDARNADGVPLRRLVYRRGWGAARQNVLSILRRWIRAADDQLALLAAASNPTEPNPASGKPNLRQPPDDAIKCYRLYIASGGTQSELAEMLSRELGRPIDQPKVSRWIKEVKAWVKAGNVLPDLTADSGAKRKAAPMDSEKIDSRAGRKPKRYRAVDLDPSAEMQRLIDEQRADDD